MRRTVFASMLTTAILAPAMCFADPAQTSEDIVKFFATAVDLGAQRGICVGTEEECREKQDGQAVPTGLDMLINFDLDSAELTDDARSKLAEFAKALADNRLRSHSFLVEGHTDASGPESYNDGLSERRAQSVTAFLLANGIDTTRLQAYGKGESSPRTADPYDAANRRVEMRINIQ